MTTLPMTRPRVPAPKPVRDMLTELLGRNVEVTVGAPYAPRLGESGTLAVYVDDATIVRAVMVADLPLSAYAGAAIGLVPVAGAEEAIELKLLPQSLEENLYEVLNISASLLNAEGLPHLRLYQMYAPGNLPPAEVSACARIMGGRLDLTVEIAGYGRGRLSVVVLG
jgi:hypothetical protein